MAVTILEALINAQINLVEGQMAIQKQIGAAQLNNAIVLLEKGYSVDDEVEPLLDKYGTVENVPEKEDSRDNPLIGEDDSWIHDNEMGAR